MRTLVVVALFGAVGCGPGGTVCRDTKMGGNFCVPDGGAPAGQPIGLEIFEQCASTCGTQTLSCTVSRDAGTIGLEITGQTCDPPVGTACPAVCRSSKFTCDLGSLPEGDYTVTAAGQASKTLHVVSDGGVPTCTGSPF